MTLDRRTAVTLPTDTEIRVTRRFAAPPALVWSATTEPEHIPHWWGPWGTVTTVHEMDFRVGGAWRFTCHMGDQEHPFRGEYRAIEPTARVEQTFVYDVPGIRDFPVVETATYEAVDGGTLLTVVIAHGSKESRDGQLASGMEGGMSESHQRLDELLATLA